MKSLSIRTSLQNRFCAGIPFLIGKTFSVYVFRPILFRKCLFLWPLARSHLLGFHQLHRVPLYVVGA